MSTKAPSSGVARHLLPRGEKEETLSPLSSPSPLAGEGGSRRLTVEGAAKGHAKALRKYMTDVEKILWSALRGRRFEGFKFRRQFPVGRFIADFACLERRLIIELDGSQHEGSHHDAMRDEWLGTQGFEILRFWNVDVLQALDGTLLAILGHLQAAPSSGVARHLLPRGEKEDLKETTQ